MALTQPQRGKIIAAVITVVIVGGWAWTQLANRSVDAEVDDLRATTRPPSDPSTAAGEPTTAFPP